MTVDLRLKHLYARIESAQVSAQEAIVIAKLHGAREETVVQLTLAAQSLEAAYDRVKRADEAEMA